VEKSHNTCGKPVESVRKIFRNDKNYKILVIGDWGRGDWRLAIGEEVIKKLILVIKENKSSQYPVPST
jgi:hypothetical protein